MKNITILGLVALMSVACGGTNYESESAADYRSYEEPPAAVEASPAEESEDNEDGESDENVGEKASSLYTITVDQDIFGDWEQEMEASRRNLVMGHRMSGCVVSVDTQIDDGRSHDLLAAAVIATALPNAVGPDPEVSNDGSAALATFLDLDNEVVGKVIVRSIPGTDTYHLMVFASCPIGRGDMVDTALDLAIEGIRISVE